MNAEVIKAMNKTDTRFEKVCKWWKKNGYKITRIVLSPILLPVWAVYKLSDKYNHYKNAQQAWSAGRSTEILNYYIPRDAEWNEKDQCFYFFDNGMGWGHNIKKIKRKDRRYWKVNCGWWGGEMRTFLIDTFELEGFTKEIGVCDDGWTEIAFYLNKEND